MIYTKMIFTTGCVDLTSTGTGVGRSPFLEIGKKRFSLFRKPWTVGCIIVGPGKKLVGE